MTTMRPEDVAALFDLPPLPEEDAQAAAAAAEAALTDELAAELACAMESDDIAVDAPDSRTNRRVEVAWTARMRLPDGHVIALRVRNVSEAGVGLAGDQHIPACTVVDFEMDVPPLDATGASTSVTGAIKTTYTVTRGTEVLCGGTWVPGTAGLDAAGAWIERLRG